MTLIHYKESFESTEINHLIENKFSIPAFLPKKKQKEKFKVVAAEFGKGGSMGSPYVLFKNKLKTSFISENNNV